MLGFLFLNLKKALVLGVFPTVSAVMMVTVWLVIQVLCGKH